jgi:hypothetical protein
VIKCVGFEVNEGNERLVGRSCMLDNGFVDHSVSTHFEPHLDERSNGLPLISYINALNYNAAKSITAPWPTNRGDCFGRVRMNHVTASQQARSVLKVVSRDPIARVRLKRHLQDLVEACQTTFSPEHYVDYNRHSWNVLNNLVCRSTEHRTNEAMQYPFDDALLVLQVRRLNIE